jgi:hypothetical protein
METNKLNNTLPPGDPSPTSELFPDDSKHPKPKTVNLFEDMNTHEHDEASYQQMLKEQKAQNS